MDAKKKKWLKYGGLGAVALVVVYVLWKRSQSTAGQPDPNTLGQYAAVFPNLGSGGGVFFTGSGPASGSPTDGPGTAPALVPKPGAFDPGSPGAGTSGGLASPGDTNITKTGGGGIAIGPPGANNSGAIGGNWINLPPVNSGGPVNLGGAPQPIPNPAPIPGPGGPSAGGSVGSGFPVITTLAQITTNPAHFPARPPVGPANFGTGGPIGTRPFMGKLGPVASIGRPVKSV